MYSNADVYVFDDPLSAVDSHVANHIFNKCFLELLEGKTIILATHSVSFLKYADNILLVEGGDRNKNQIGGSIKLQGKLQQFIDAKVNLTKFIVHHKDKEDGDEKSDALGPLSLAKRRRKTTLLSDPGIANQRMKGDLMKEEERGVGHIGWDIYGLYVAAAGGMCLFLMCIGFMGSYYGSNTVSQFWLAFWSDSDVFGHSVDREQWWWLKIYISIQLGSLLMLFCSAVMALITRLRASKYLHEALLYKMLHAPMEFFGTSTSYIYSFHE